MRDSFEDPWGDDLPAETSPSGRPTGADVYREATAAFATRFAVRRGREDGVASLHSMCLGCLGRYLEDVLDLGPEVASMLTAPEKASLLAVARRQGTLGDEVLSLLVDEDFSRLELADTRVTPEGLKKALPHLGRLQHLSLIRGNALEPSVLGDLARSCPELISLRLDAADTATGTALCKSLLSLLPVLTCAREAEDWEESAVPCSARPAFTKLRYLLWPSARADWLSRLSERCPKLVINPAQRNFDRLAPAALRWPEEADIRMPLDATDAGLVSQLDLRSEQPDDTHAAAKDRLRGEMRPGELSLAERFRLAYVAQAGRQALKAERNRKQAWRRYVRAHPTEALIRMAESGVPLRGTRR